MVSYVLKEKRAIPKLGDALAKTSWCHVFLSLMSGILFNTQWMTPGQNFERLIQSVSSVFSHCCPSPFLFCTTKYYPCCNQCHSFIFQSTHCSPFYFYNDFESPNGFDGLVKAVNRDDGNPDRGPSDWFKLCNLDDLFLTANIGYVSLFVDTSGSMKLKTVKPSYNKFTSEVEARSKNVSLVWNPKEDCENFTATKVFAAMEMDTSRTSLPPKFLQPWRWIQVSSFSGFIYLWRTWESHTKILAFLLQKTIVLLGQSHTEGKLQRMFVM